MKIKLKQHNKNYWHYNTKEYLYTQQQYDYIYKYLDFDKLYKDNFIYFNNEEVEECFGKTYICSNYLKNIYNESLLGYKYLKSNWGKGIFIMYEISYKDKLELKTIVNRVINMQLIRG